MSQEFANERELEKEFEEKYDLIKSLKRKYGADYQEIFATVAQWATVLTHPANRGKGAALKTAFTWFLENRPDGLGVVTVDGDNQHHPADTRACCEHMMKTGHAVLGCRDFNQEDVPARSSFGNKTTSLIFKIFVGMTISDTQTGLRALPRKVLEELVDALLVKFHKHYPDTVVQIDIPEEFVSIPMDAMLIEQVIINLLENAVQHSRGMTSLTLRTLVRGDKAVFEIEDNGCGIDPKRLETLFSGYDTSDHTVADGQKKNAGIGLSVCASIINAHGGEIQAENRKTGGALFRFILDTEELNDDTE